MWVKIGRQVDPGEWDMIPSEVNAYYSREHFLQSIEVKGADARATLSSGQRDCVPRWNPSGAILQQGLVRTF